MTVPVENYFAAFPASYRAGNVTVAPLTLGGAIRLAHEGIDCGVAVPREKLYLAAFVLSGETDYKKFLRRAKCGLQELSNAVESALNNAFETYVKPPSPESGTRQRVTPHGYGWPLEIAEFLCGEYGWSWRDALATPVVTANALVATSRQRHGDEPGGFDYVERIKEREVHERKRRAAAGNRPQPTSRDPNRL